MEPITVFEQKPNVLFLCTGNSCRSQMAEGWARQLQAESVNAYSAGTMVHGLNPLAVRAMAELGGDIATHESKHFDELSHLKFDYVFTVCSNANSNCPTFPGATTVIHRPFDDPPALARDAGSEQNAMQHYVRVCREIRDWISGFQGEMG